MNNSHVIYAKFKGPTDTRGAYISLSTHDLTNNSQEKMKRKKLCYDYCHDTYRNTMIAIEAVGLEIIAMNDRSPNHIIFVCKWDYEKLCSLFGSSFI